MNDGLEVFYTLSVGHRVDLCLHAVILGYCLVEIFISVEYEDCRLVFFVVGL